MATYFWVGGAGTWSGTGNTQFAATSGGVATLLNPTSADTVNFDANSGAGVVSVDATAVSLSTTLNNSNIDLSLTGSPTLCTTAGIFTFTQGTITLNTFILTCGRFNSSNSNIRTIAFGTGNITLTGNAATIWTTSAITNFSYTGTPTINATYSGGTGTRVISSTGNETQVLNFNVSAGTDTVQFIAGSNSAYGSISYSGFSGTATSSSASNINIFRNLTVSATCTYSVTAQTTFAATSGTQQITSAGKTFDFAIIQNGVGGTVQLQDNLTMGSTRTFTLTAGTLDLNNLTLSTRLFSSSNSNVRSIAFGTGQIDVTGNSATIFSVDNSQNFSYTGTPTVNFTYAGAVGTRTITGASAATGTETNVLNYNITAGSDIITISALRAYKNIDFTGFSGTLNNNTRTLYGNLTISSGMTVTAGTAATTFAATSGTQQITTNSVTLDFPLTFNGIGGTFAFQDALTQGSTRAFTITNGTVQLKNGVTSTVGAFATSGTNQKFLQSTLAGSQATLSQASGTVNASYLTIQDINATGGATWNAYVNQFNSDAGNVDGWDFGISPVVGGAEYTYSMRSFTQPRRF